MARKPDSDSASSEAIVNGQLVDRLMIALCDTEGGLRKIPKMMSAVLSQESWRERRIRTGRIVKFDRFIDFLTANPLEGLGEDPELIKRILRDDVETLTAFESATREGTQGTRTDLGSNTTDVMNKDRGKSYTLRRLKKDRPDLFEEVVEGKLSANQAAIKAGWRKTKTPLEQMATLWGKLSDDDKKAFLAMVEM